MAVSKKSGQSASNSGGIYQRVGPRGGKRNNFATVADNKPLPRRRLLEPGGHL